MRFASFLELGNTAPADEGCHRWSATITVSGRFVRHRDRMFALGTGLDHNGTTLSGRISSPGRVN
jgi:hypothetical protein